MFVINKKKSWSQGTVSTTSTHTRSLVGLISRILDLFLSGISTADTRSQLIPPDF